MRSQAAFAALLLAGPGLSFAQERPCAAGPAGANVVTEGRSSFGPALPLEDPSAPAAFPAGSLRAASFNPGRPAPANSTQGQRVIAREYDDFDRLKSETVDLEDGGQATIRYTYWRNGLRKTATDASGRVTFYEYEGCIDVAEASLRIAGVQRWA